MQVIKSGLCIFNENDKKILEKSKDFYFKPISYYLI